MGESFFLSHAISSMLNPLLLRLFSCAILAITPSLPSLNGTSLVRWGTVDHDSKAWFGYLDSRSKFLEPLFTFAGFFPGFLVLEAYEVTSLGCS
jgi:hypothetical protein